MFRDFVVDDQVKCGKWIRDDFSLFHLEKSLEGRLRTILISLEFSPRRLLASRKFITVQDQSLRHSSYGESKNDETE
ncbi:hypothetical protein Hanom_Chr01g00003571 [Helianthus anomalus]